MGPISLAIHGGAGTILRAVMTAEKERQYRQGLEQALDSAYRLLEAGSSSVDAVEQAVVVLEDNPLFNAGKGSVFAADGLQYMDASIMDGSNQDAGAVAAVQGVRNPIRLARTIMDQSNHVFLNGSGAEDFARLHGLAFEDPTYFYDALRYAQWQKLKGSEQVQLDHSDHTSTKFGTVGAVALDQYGHLAAATSTGGMTNKRFGRVGDSPMIGAGTYANDKTCAVSSTGSGEFFIRGVVAYDVSCLMEYRGYDLQMACEEVVFRRLSAIGGDGGVIAVDSTGALATVFNTKGMYRAYRRTGQAPNIAIYRD